MPMGAANQTLEIISFGGGGGSNKTLVAAIQPRSSSFNTGEVLTAEITNGSRVLGTRVFSILPPNISSPALVSYNVEVGMLPLITAMQVHLAQVVALRLF